MKHARKYLTGFAVVATLVVGLVGLAAAIERPSSTTRAVVTAPDLATLAPMERLMAIRKDFRTVLVDTGLPSGEVTDLVDQVDHLTRYIAHVSVEAPDQLNGYSVDELITLKVTGYLAEKGVTGPVAGHLAALANQMTVTRLDVDASVDAPSIEGSTR